MYACITNTINKFCFVLISIAPPTNFGPQILSSPEVSTVVLSGTSLTFDCIATGLPLPNFMWSRESVNIISDSHISIVESIEGSNVTSSLTISDVQLSDAGSYSCIASNSEGDHTSDFTLIVEGKLILCIPYITKYCHNMPFIAFIPNDCSHSYCMIHDYNKIMNWQ